MRTQAAVFVEKTALMVDVLVQAVVTETKTVLTAANLAWFTAHCDRRFRYYHRTNAKWRKWLEDRDSRIDPRDQCKVWIRHWLAAFALDPDAYRERHVDHGCPDCGSDEWYTSSSDGFVWEECDACGYKEVVQSPGESAGLSPIWA